MLKYIDTHSHIHFGAYDEDRALLFARMEEAGVATIVVGTGLETSKQAVALAEANPTVVVGATIGVHPNDTDEEFNAGVFQQLLNSEARPHCCKVAGVGECGLDYFRMDGGPALHKATQDKQAKNFRLQIEFALEYDLPLMLHVRPSKGSADAHDDALKILEGYKQRGLASLLRGTCHFFTGSAEVALKYVELGFYVSFPGVVTFASETHGAVEAVPLDKILSETDSPYAAPVPHRGGRNEPTYVVEVVKKIAEIKGLDEEVVRAQLLQNARKLFAIRAGL